MAMSLGAKDHLAKPFDDAQLLARVASLTTQRVSLRPASQFI
jgi:DNA-binding response OmpR family regulator